MSRLVPGGRVPVLVATVQGGYPWQRVAAAVVLVALQWAVTCTVVWVVGAMPLTVVAQVVQRHRRSR